MTRAHDSGWVLSAVAAFGSWLAATPVLACSPIPCGATYVRPAEGATVPANLVAIEYVPGLFQGESGDEEEFARTFELHAESGARIELEVEPVPSRGFYRLRPKTALTPETTYRMRFQRLCDPDRDFSRPNPQWFEQTFTAGPESAVPEAIGTIDRVHQEIRRVEVPTTSGSCTSPITAAIAHIDLELTPELRDALPLVTLLTFVDGEPFGARSPAAASDRITLDVRAGCIVKDQGTYGYVDSGEHRIEVRAEILGQSTLPASLSTDVDFECDPGDSAADGGSDEAASDSEGCSALPASGGASVALSVLLAALLARRRRRHSS